MMRFVILVLLFTGCQHLADTYRVNTVFDQIALRPSIAMYENKLDAPQTATFGGLLFNVTKTVDVSGDRYGITVIYRGDDWLSMRLEQPLQVFVDGKRIDLSCELVRRDPLAKSPKDLAFGHWSLSETGIYSVTLSQLRDISNGGEVVVRLVGNTVVDGKFTKENFRRLREFLAPK